LRGDQDIGLQSKGLAHAIREEGMIDQPLVTSSQPLVLVVDDFQDNREMYAEYLAYCGFRVIEAKNGKEAIDQAFSQKPNVIIMDLSLPVMDGWEATRRLKADRRTKSIPVIALTGHALQGHSQGALDAGCDAFVAKPCLPDQLVLEIRRMLAAPGSEPVKG
jgi:CheY-like chemotaxis protein